MAALIVVVFHLLGVLSSIHAIMTTRTEQGTIAWAVSLNTFPYLAVPAYWVLGRSRFEGYVAARRENLEAVAGITKEVVVVPATFLADHRSRNGPIPVREPDARRTALLFCPLPAASHMAPQSAA